jgi:biopolymer transport protein ExbD
MTSLIDVIFILLLFFLLTSTFTRFGELSVSTGGAGAGIATVSPIFLRLEADGLTLNGTHHALDTVASALEAFAPGDDSGATVLISVADGVSSQRLVDLLVLLRPLDWADVTVLG